MDEIINEELKTAIINNYDENLDHLVHKLACSGIKQFVSGRVVANPLNAIKRDVDMAVALKEKGTALTKELEYVKDIQKVKTASVKEG